MKLDSSYRVSGANWAKREFNATSIDDLNEYKYFLQNDHWKTGCPFFVEWPHTNVVSMIEHKIVSKHLNSIIKYEAK